MNKTIGKWTLALPKEQGVFWWWCGDEDSGPVTINILYSGTDGNYFAPAGQYGWTEFQLVQDMGGWWMKLETPELPDLAAAHHGEEVPLDPELLGIAEGLNVIGAERLRQIVVKKCTAAQDDEHRHGEIASAAAGYTALAAAQGRSRPGFQASQMFPPRKEHIEWPWGDEAWKPSDDPIHNLAKAGALIAAEISRLQRLQARTTATPETGGERV